MNGMKLAPKPGQDAIRQTEFYTTAISIYQKTYQRNYTVSQAMEDAKRMSDFCRMKPEAVDAFITATLDVLNSEKGRKPKELTLVVAGGFIKEIAVQAEKINNALASVIMKKVLPDLPMGIGPFGGRNELDIQVLRAVLGALNELDIDAWRGSNRDIALQKGYLEMISDSIDKLDNIAKRNGDASKTNLESKEIFDLTLNLRERLGGKKMKA